MTVIIFGLFGQTFAYSEPPASFDETVQSGEAQFQVKLDNSLNEVRVIQQKPNLTPGNLKIRILRKNKRPLEVKLHLMAKEDNLFAYTGKASPWAGSLMGFELEFSFDKKTWKKVLKILP
jgi:hypothetical protein